MPHHIIRQGPAEVTTSIATRTATTGIEPNSEPPCLRLPRLFIPNSRSGRVPTKSWDNIAEETAAISDTGSQLVNAYWIAGLNDYPSGEQGRRWRLQL